MGRVATSANRRIRQRHQIVAAAGGGGGGGFTDPSDIAELELWLDADMETAYSDGDTVTTFNDQSGNARHFTNDAGTPEYKTGIVNGRAVVRFVAGESMVAGSNFASGFTAAEMMIVFNVPDATPAAASAAPFVAQGQTGTGSHVPWVDGGLYDSWGSTARKTTGGTSPATLLESFTCYNVRSAAGSWVSELNGAPKYSTGTNTVGFSHIPRLARTNHGGTRDWLGDIAAVYMFSKVLGSTERADMESYIATRFGITFA